MNEPQAKPIVKLCSGAQGCPTVERREEGVEIRDDFGGKVVLTEEQWTDFLHRVEQKQFADWA